MRLLILCIIVILSSCSTGNESTVENKGNTDSIILNQSDTAVTISEGEKIQIEFSLDSLLNFDSELKLKEVFGNHVKRSKGSDQEGVEEYPITLLFPNTSDEVEFVWREDSINFSDLDYIKIRGKESRWKTSEGITLGTTLKELEEINQKPFIFYGFGWDYSGAVTSEDGHLFERKIFVSLEYPAKSIPPDFEELVGEKKINSNSELAQKSNPIVREITMRR
jgi:hypothetical protein